MKVALPKDYRSNFTMEDLDRAKAVIKFEKEEDESTAKEWAEYMINEAIGFGENIVEIFKASATVEKNCRAWNSYTEDSQNMDVWIKATAEVTSGFIQCGAYLSDIWATGATPYKEHMYIRKATFTA